MREYVATLHGYKIVTPPRCKLERLEPVTEEIAIPLHYAESAPVAMRTAGPLEYTGKDGNTYTWRGEAIELYALDGKLWRRAGSSYWDGKQITLETLASIIDEYHIIERWPYQWGSDDEPPRGLLARDKGTWGLIDNVRERLLEQCDRYAVIAGEMYEPARELVYTYEHNSAYGWGRRSAERAGSVIVAKEYNQREEFNHYLCNALQDWREVNIFDEHADRYQDKIMHEITGADVIEVLMPEYVNADPYGDFWRKEIEIHREKAERCKEAAKEHAERARRLKEDAKRDREAAARELEEAAKIAEKLETYLASDD